MPTRDGPPLHEARMRALEQGHEYLAAQLGELVVEMRHVRADIPKLMAEGIAAAVGNPATWAAAKLAMQSQAKQAAGGWLFRSLMFALDKAFWAVVALIALYMTGGLPAVLAILKIKAST